MLRSIGKQKTVRGIRGRSPGEEKEGCGGKDLQKRKALRSLRSLHRRRLHRGNRELRPGTHTRTGENVAFCPGTFHGACALIF